jgi:hypothetical protein
MSLAKLSWFQAKLRAYTILRILLGVLLLTAAGLKILGLTIDPWSQESLIWSPRLQVAAIEVEVILGIWLLIRWSLRAAWFLSLLFFAMMATVSMLLALEGQSSCGCLGHITVHPWLTFFLDLGAVVLLLFCRPEFTDRPRFRIRAWSLLKTVAGAVPFISVIAGTYFASSDKNLASILAQLRGESITVEPAITYVGEGLPGDLRNFTIEITNHAGQSIHCIGGSTSCSCIATKDLPVKLRPGETRPIQVAMRFRGGTGRFQHHFVLYTDDDKQTVVVARFAGRIKVRNDASQ